MILNTYIHTYNFSKIASVLLSALVKRFSVTHMHDFYTWFPPFSYIDLSSWMKQDKNKTLFMVEDKKEFSLFKKPTSHVGNIVGILIYIHRSTNSNKNQSHLINVFLFISNNVMSLLPSEHKLFKLKQGCLYCEDIFYFLQYFSV